MPPLKETIRLSAEGLFGGRFQIIEITGSQVTFKFAPHVATFTRVDGNGVSSQVSQPVPPIDEGEGLILINPDNGTASSSAVQCVRVRFPARTTEPIVKVNFSPEALEVLRVQQFVGLSSQTRSIQAELAKLPPRFTIRSNEEELPDVSDDDLDRLGFAKANLSKIHSAMQQYAERHRSWPPAVVFGPDGKPWHSWRVLILPFLEQKELFQSYRWDEPWDGPHNQKLVGQMPNAYSIRLPDEKNEGLTNFAVPVGAKTLFSPVGCQLEFLPVARARQFPFVPFHCSGTPYSDNRGNYQTPPANVVLGVIGGSRRVPWTKPEDVQVDKVEKVFDSADGFSTLFADKAGRAGVFLQSSRSSLYVRSSVTADLARQMCSIDVRQDALQSLPTLGPTKEERQRGFQPLLEFKQEGTKVVGRWIKVYDGKPPMPKSGPEKKPR